MPLWSARLTTDFRLHEPQPERQVCPAVNCGCSQLIDKSHTRMVVLGSILSRSSYRNNQMKWFVLGFFFLGSSLWAYETFLKVGDTPARGSRHSTAAPSR